MSNISFSSGYKEFRSGEYFSNSAFELLSNNVPIFNREIISNSLTEVNLSKDYFLIKDHQFTTGEELNYVFDLNLTNTPIGIATTVISGVSTDKLPQKLYAVKLDGYKIQVSASKTDALLDPPKVLDLTEYGSGVHILSAENQNKNALISINNVIQSPIVSTYSTSHITENLLSSGFSFKVENPSIFKGSDLIKINEEILRVISVGIGSTNSLEVEREILGTSSADHIIGDVVTVVNGNYNIVDNFIHFTEPPYGRLEDLENSNLTVKSTFSGRVFIRSGIKNTTTGPYDTNYVFDDISTQFTGITSEFTLTLNSSNITNFSQDNAIVLLNDVFQFPSRLTGSELINAYTLEENSGISTIKFIGNNVPPNYDVNLLELPRGGNLFSVGSTEGFGYQPLISAGGTAIVSSAGTIQSVSIGYSGSGYRSGLQIVNVGVALSDVIDTNIEYVGKASVSNGRIVGVSITNPGVGYTHTNPPLVVFDDPLPYFNVPLVYSSGSTGIGTFASVDIVVSQDSSVLDFKLNNLGYGYGAGEVLTVSIGGTVGIPTQTDLPFTEFQLFVDEVYYDKFAGRSIGELVIIDPLDDLFDGQRTIFPIKINGEQTAILSKVGSEINVENALLVFIDNILQVPGEAYFFDGGSIIEFSEPPLPGSTGTILFYGGTSGVDTEFTEVLQTIKIGDTVKIFDNNDQFYNQNSRLVTDIISADIINTNLYYKQGISTTNEERSITWCLQTEDKFISGSGSTVSSVVSKDRRIYEPHIQPSSYLINNVSSGSSVFFVDNLKTFFDNDNEPVISNDIFVVSQNLQVSASATAVVSTAGTIQSISIGSSGFGYSQQPLISIANPTGVGSTAYAISTINSEGSISSITITNPGSGYSANNPPLIIIEQPSQETELINEVSFEGDFGYVVGVGTTSVGAVFDLYIPINSFVRDSNINASASNVSGIQTGYYFYISNSNIGSNITSLRDDDSVIGISTAFFDGVYQVNSTKTKQKNIAGIGLTTVREVTVKISNTSSLVGYSNTSYYGNFSWGRIYNIIRSGIGSFESYSPGITTSTIIQRNNPLKYFNYV